MKRQRIGGIGSAPFILGCVLTGCIVVGITGCQKEEIHSYRVARSPDSTPATAAPVQQPQAATPHVIWTAPDTWREVETTNSMRKNTYLASNGQEIAVSAFPGDVGGLLANVNRWRGQVGLDPIVEQELEGHIERIEGVDVIVADIDGTSERLIGSSINVGDGLTWFVKATGPADLVGQIKDELIAFSSTFHIHDHSDGAHDGSHDGSQDHAHESASAPVEPADDEPVSITTSGWMPPAEWTAEENASDILMAAYLSESGGRFTVTSLVGDGGGMLGNINRWRSQLGLDLVQSLDEQPLKNLGGDAVLVDLVALDGGERMAAGIVPIGGQTLFFKLTGSASAVEAELERFEAFINAEGVERTSSP